MVGSDWFCLAGGPNGQGRGGEENLAGYACIYLVYSRCTYF